MRYSGKAAGAFRSWSREEGSCKGSILASAYGSLDVNVKPGIFAQAQLPSRRQGAPAGLEKVPSGWYSWGGAKQRVTACLCRDARKLAGECGLDTETAGELTEEPLLLCTRAIPRVRQGGWGKVKGWEVAGKHHGLDLRLSPTLSRNSQCANGHARFAKRYALPCCRGACWLLSSISDLGV